MKRTAAQFSLSRRGTRTLVALILALGTMGATWHVHPDPTHPDGQVGAAADSAASGDTIVVESGVYYEHIPISGKSLSFLAPAGSAATILDGGRPFPGRDGSILYTIGGGPADLRMEGFTLRNGAGALSETGLKSGGAICWWNNHLGDCAVDLRACVFQDNTTDNDGGGDGGALYTSCVPVVTVSSCSFVHNSARQAGGAVALSGCGQTYTVSTCTFDVQPSGEASACAIRAYGSGALTIDNSSFTTNGEGWDPSTTFLLRLEVESVLLTNNVFTAHAGSLGTRMLISSMSFEYPFVQLAFRGNVLWNADCTTPDYGVQVVLVQGHADIRENTFAYSHMDVAINTGDPLLCANNTFYRSGVIISDHVGGVVHCNDAWPDTIMTRDANITVTDNVSADPLFCGEATGDFHIARESPCAPDHTPGSCGLIGRLGVACSFSPVQRVTWGGIRQLFR